MLQNSGKQLKDSAKTQAKIIEERTVENKKHPYPAVLELMAGCLDAQLIVDEICKDIESKNLESVGIQDLKRLCKVAGHANDTIGEIVDEYDTFKKRLDKIVLNTDEDNIREKFGSLLFETHQCSADCSVPGQRCPDLHKVILPLKVINIKILHLFLKTESLYSDIEKFLCLYLQCAVKTHAEGVAESMGSYVDIHSNKRRGLDIAVVGSESYIHWNGPPIHLADSIGQASLDSYFAGRSHWRFVTRKNKSESAVVSRLRNEKAKSKLFE